LKNSVRIFVDLEETRIVLTLATSDDLFVLSGDQCFMCFGACFVSVCVGSWHFRIKFPVNQSTYPPSDFRFSSKRIVDILPSAQIDNASIISQDDWCCF